MNQWVRIYRFSPHFVISSPVIQLLSASILLEDNQTDLSKSLVLSMLLGKRQ